MIKGWITWDNRTVPINEMTHQHMSNIYYYINFTLPEYYDNSTRMEILQLLLTKFGSILPYRPDPRFEWEKNYLKKLGYLRENNEIYIDGKKVGEYQLAS